MSKKEAKQIGNICKTKNRENPNQGRVYDKNHLSPCLNSMGGGNRQPMIVDTLKIKQATKTGYVECEVGGAVDLTYVTSKTRRGRVTERGNICPTITTENTPSILERFIWKIKGRIYLIRIRKLTPKECFRLMGFTDEQFEKAESVNSNTQLYKQAGNSIVVDVLESIFSELFWEDEDE